MSGFRHASGVMQRWHAAVACCAHATARSSSPEACWAEARRRAQAAAQGLPRVGAALPAGAAGELLRMFHSLAADAVASVRAAAAASLPALAALLPPSVRGALGGAAAALARDAARPVAAAAAAALGPFLAELAPEDVSDGTLLSVAAPLASVDWVNRLVTGLQQQAMLCSERAHVRCCTLLSAASMCLLASSVFYSHESLGALGALQWPPQPSSLGPRRPIRAAGCRAGQPRGRRRGGCPDRGHAAAHRARARARPLARATAGAGRLRGGGCAGRARRGGRRGNRPGHRTRPRADRGGAHAAAGCAPGPSCGVPDGTGV